MISFALSADRIKSAPPEIRRWLENEIVAALRDPAPPRPEPVHAPELAACSPDEAIAVFELIHQDFAALQVLLELGREPPLPGSPPPLHALAIGDVKRSLRLADDRLAGCFAAIGDAFRRVRNDPEAVLLGFDQANHVYVHQATHASLRVLWERLTARQSEAATGARPSPATFGFVPPRVGPSDDIAAHEGATQ